MAEDHIKEMFLEKLLENDVEKVKYLMKVTPSLAFTKSHDGFPAIFFSFHQKDTQCLKLLLDAKVDPCQYLPNGDTLLHSAVIDGNKLAVIALLAAGARACQVNLKDKLRPSSFAKIMGCEMLYEILVDAENEQAGQE